MKATINGMEVEITDEGSVFAGGLLDDPVSTLRLAFKEIEQLSNALEYIQRHRMIVGEMAYIVARNALGNEGKSYTQIYEGQPDPTVALINEPLNTSSIGGKQK